MERAVRRPLRLEDGFVRPARDPLDVLGGRPSASTSQTTSSVPSQGMFGWFHVSHASRLAVRAQARRGVEVVARDEHGLLAVFEVYADYLVDGLASPRGPRARR